jgi:predicted Zn-dependent protease
MMHAASAEPLAMSAFDRIHAASQSASATAAEEPSRVEAAARAMARGQFDKAAELYAALVNDAPRNAGLLMNLGMARYQAGRTREALAPLRSATRLDPSLRPAWLFLGIVELEMGSPARAATALEKAVSLGRDDVRARELLGRAMLGAQRFRAAGAQFETLASGASASALTLDGLARSREGEARATFELLQQRPEAEAATTLLVADVLVSADKLDEAVDAVKRAVSLAPKWRTTHESLAELLAARDESEQAAAALARAEATPRDCSKEAAACAFAASKLRDVLSLTERTTAPEALFWRVKALDALAFEAFERLRAMPPSSERHTLVGLWYLDHDDAALAETELRAALALAPGLTTIVDDLAASYSRQRKFDDTIALLQPLQSKGDLSARGSFLYGDALVELQRLDEAIPILESAARRDPNQPIIRSTLGRALVLADRAAEALPHLQAARVSDRDGSVYYQLAQAYQRLGRGAEAKAAMDEYVRRKDK